MSADPKETPCHASDPPDHSPDRCGRGGSRGTGRVRVLDLATQIKVAQQATSQSTDPEAGWWISICSKVGTQWENETRWRRMRSSNVWGS